MLGLPSGLPGGGITGMVPPFGVGALMSGSPTRGGQITPPDWASLSLKFLPVEVPALLAHAFSLAVCACARAAERMPWMMRIEVNTSLMIVFTP